MRIAVLEDDADQRAELGQMLCERLALQDVHVAATLFERGEALRRALQTDTFDLLVLDWSVPDLDGVELLRWLRGFQKDHTPVMMLSAHGSDRWIAKALDLGADDYVVKPFSVVELCARVRRLLRQRGESAQPDAAHERFGAWLFDRSALCVEWTSAADDLPHRMALTAREFRTALTLFRHAGRAISRAYLLERWGPEEDAPTSSRALDSHIYRLRRKLGLQPSNGVQLQTLYGHGYRLEWISPDDLATASTAIDPAP